MLKLIEHPKECAYSNRCTNRSVLKIHCEYPKDNFYIQCNDPDVFPLTCPLQTGTPITTHPLVRERVVDTVGKILNDPINPKSDWHTEPAATVVPIATIVPIEIIATPDRREYCTYHGWWKGPDTEFRSTDGERSHKCFCLERKSAECIGVDCGHYTTEPEQQTY